jgi:hypothetical protein
MDNKNRIIVGVDNGAPDKKTDGEKALQQIRRVKWRYNLINEGIDPHIPIMDYRSQNDKGIYPIEKFTFDKERNIFICPEGRGLKYWGIHKHSKQHVYRARRKDCRVCPQKALCTRDSARSVSFHIYEDSIKRARELNKTKGYRISQLLRKRIEELFGEAKEFMGLRRAKFRGTIFLREQVLMTATAQNIKRMVKLLSRGGDQNEAIATSYPMVFSFIGGLFKSLTWWRSKIRGIPSGRKDRFATT